MQQMESDRNFVHENNPQPFQNGQYPQYPYLPVPLPNPSIAPNASIPPFYDPYGTYPVVMTEAFMK